MKIIINYYNKRLKINYIIEYLLDEIYGWKLWIGSKKIQNGWRVIKFGVIIKIKSNRNIFKLIDY